MKQLLLPGTLLRPASFLCFLLLGFHFGTFTALSQTVPELIQDRTSYNTMTQRGVPISSSDPGSDGRQPTVPQQQAAGETIVPATPGQFQSFVPFGSVAATPVTMRGNLNGGSSFVANAVATDLPRGLNGGVVTVVMTRASVGAPFAAQRISLLFGAVIPPPTTDINTNLLNGVLSTDYWLAEPHTTNGHANAGYYYSPNARQVFAIQPGQVIVTWKKAAPSNTVPTDFTSNPQKYSLENGNYYSLLTVRYVASGTPVKKPQKIYWTEGEFATTGKGVDVPAARVGWVLPVYNSTFPERVAHEYRLAGQTSIAPPGTPTFEETRTLWYERNQIRAYNLEGRLFVELLGDFRSDGVTRKFLGFEIVDVLRQPTPSDITVELGERLRAYQDLARDDSKLTPQEVPNTSASSGFTFTHYRPGGEGRPALYATRATVNQNDLHVHWMAKGEQELLWPEIFARYTLVWPTSAGAYSHYVRPLVSSQQEAQSTAIALPQLNQPTLDYQDPLDQPRGFLTAQSAYYSFLTADYPAHRALLRYTSGDKVSFERVFSWLDQTLVTGTFAGSVATNLSHWNPTNNTFIPMPEGVTPRVVQQTVNVGDRIAAPSGELGAASRETYWAGQIVQGSSLSYDPTSYIDPKVAGFEAANRGAIIPVNSIPGGNRLEVFWFRRNKADSALGFTPVYWPAVVGQYTIQWPVAASEIVLASNAGSGPLPPPQAQGQLYVQNDPALVGYNPNEEHALILAGQVYALRDDLNITTPPGYSSDPFVLLRYAGEDGRPSMRLFKVRREAPERGIVFDYITEAGHILQAPMPLPLMSLPISAGVNWNVATGNEVPRGWSESSDANGPYAHYRRFTFEDRKHNHWVYRGLHEEPPLLAGTYVSATDSFNANLNATAVRQQPFSYTIHASQRSSALELIPVTPLPTWLTVTKTLVYTDAFGSVRTNASALALSGTPPNDAPLGTTTYSLVVSNIVQATTTTVTLALGVAATGNVVSQAPLIVTSGAGVTYVDRPPFLARTPSSANSFSMRFSYVTQPGFAWPGRVNPPTVGTVVPYLRPTNPDGGFVGNGSAAGDPALAIVYRPVWPDHDPADPLKPLGVLQFGATATVSANGLPAIRGQRTLRVLYQQSAATNSLAGGMSVNHESSASVTLFDPTRAKVRNNVTLPASVRAEVYQGNVYFPDLPPHLAKRLYLIPSGGNSRQGTLVLEGRFQDDATGEKYLQLNLLPNAGAEALALCKPDDKDYSNWRQAVRTLSTSILTFKESLLNNRGPWSPRTTYFLNDTVTFNGTNYTAIRNNFDGEDKVPSDSTAYWLNRALLSGQFTVDPTSTREVDAFSIARIDSDETAVDSYALSATGPGTGYVTLLAGNGRAFTDDGDPVSMYVIRVGGGLHQGQMKVWPSENPLSELVSFQHTPDLAGSAAYEYQWMIAPPVNGSPLQTSNDSASTEAMQSIGWQPLANGSGLGTFTLGGSGIRVLADNYLTLRYRPTDPKHPLYQQWSRWTQPALAEGWIKRVLAGINPFNQRAKDLFNNKVNTEVSLLTQAGRRWEGDIALNAQTLNDYGLIEIYETVLRRGQSLSINAAQPINYGPANDALLLAAGYINDLYMILGDEARADASNPTIGIGTKDKTYGDIATSLFSFKGQVPSLLEEELTLLRGRNDFLQPSVGTAPFYNRLVWNYTRGINSGEAIYALNYNILDQDGDGTVGASDAARQFPQGHGDAYGHYLTALTGFYSLLMNTHFDWVPSTEAVNVLGVPVQVGYQHERQFAAAAAAVARTGKQVVDLTWRLNYDSRGNAGWESLSGTRTNTATGRTELWALDHWAARTGEGAYLHWLVGNAILPAVDTDPDHVGIQKIDRTTVLELQELAGVAEDLQVTVDNAEAGSTPIGMPKTAVPFDINPNGVVNGDQGTHFEQIYERANAALNNAVASFDDAKDVTRLLRSEQDSLRDYTEVIGRQELSYTNSLVELYGTPYPDDIGPGKAYAPGYAGPDVIHFAYVDAPELTSTSPSSQGFLTPFGQARDVVVPLQRFPEWWATSTARDSFSFSSSERLNSGSLLFDTEVSKEDRPGPVRFAITNQVNGIVAAANRGSLTFHYEGDSLVKPPQWKTPRRSTGKLQVAAAEVMRRQHELLEALLGSERDNVELNAAITHALGRMTQIEAELSDVNQIVKSLKAIQISEFVKDVTALSVDIGMATLAKTYLTATSAVPGSQILGTSVGGDIVGPALRAALSSGYGIVYTILKTVDNLAKLQAMSVKFGEEDYIKSVELDIKLRTALKEMNAAVFALQPHLSKVQQNIEVINGRLRNLDEAKRGFSGLVAAGERIQVEREAFRRGAASVIQGYRTRDAAFRLFRDEKLERYKTLFDLAARYAFMAAQAYDYETGLLGSAQGQRFISRIIQSRSLGVIRSGEPQFAGSIAGDPGLSSAMAEMFADWRVIKGRLGFNNPDAYGTTASMRTENYRILPGSDGDPNWTDVLQRGRMENLLADSDVRRYCMQIDRGDGLPVPGIVLRFTTTIASGLNLFGQPLASQDHSFSVTSFGTKIFAAGVALVGYRGMDNPAANTSAVTGAGGTSPLDPNLAFLDTRALAANPYIYLIPVGLDSMRTPPLGDQNAVRTWTVDDVSVPIPFNIGASGFSTAAPWLSSGSLSEPLFSLRKHQAFRPVSAGEYFSQSIYTSNGGLQRSQYTNNRLIGRSVWNTEWKLVIPGSTLLNDPKEGLERFIASVKDIKLNFVTYSYSGN